jgi:hypothetical protein
MELEIKIITIIISSQRKWFHLIGKKQNARFLFFDVFIILTSQT